MTISLKKIEMILNEANLLKEFVHDENWQLSLPVSDRELSQLSYDSRQVNQETLFFCKGLNFKESYLVNAVADGLRIYVAEEPYDVTAELGIIVTDIRKAMALISMAFYDYPQEKLTLIGFTGTKGKTTAAYFSKFILDQATQQKTAMLSTMNTTLDGKNYFKSTLTTPESLDLYRMMAQAVDNGMTHLIMEVSSQAYKVDRVFGLTFDIGIFLNISPDHISPIEHPTFDDYFYCKRQLIKHSKRMILNFDSPYFQLLAETAQNAEVPFFSYSGDNVNADYRWQAVEEDPHQFYVLSDEDPLEVSGTYSINLLGDFNKDNALSSLLATRLAGASQEAAITGLAEALVPGRMEQLTHTNGAHIYVDYAHNLVSLENLLQFAKDAHPEGRVITVIGSPGNKALSRRQDFGQVLTKLTDVAILTADDPAFEDPKEIAKEIAQAISNPEIVIHYQMDRQQAIALALSLSQPQDSVVIAGKGVDLYQKVAGVDQPYEGDFAIAKRYSQN